MCLILINPGTIRVKRHGKPAVVQRCSSLHLPVLFMLHVAPEAKDYGVLYAE
jgi:hypothetical protein